MSFQIPSLDRLIHELTKLPGIGEKTAQRLAFFILKDQSGYSTRLQEALEDVQSHIHNCPQCFSYTDAELCRICANPHRDSSLLCVAEDASDVVRIETMGSYRGLYHVLQGTISPLEGIGPDQLRIRELLQRMDSTNPVASPIKEVIFALDADLEGDTTALYLSKLLNERSIKVTRIAHGVPFGSNIDYIDQRTLGRAFENRVVL